jgi:hypothetical protein
MPRVSTGPNFNTIRNVSANHVMAPDETIASVTPPQGGLTSGLTIFLPGPTTPVPPGAQPVALPGGGDYYTVCDPTGAISGAHNLTVDGGGFKLGTGIMGGPGLPDQIVSDAPFSEATFTFDDVQQVWIVCICLWQPPI